ncbi:lipocalin family protein [Halobacteriovorax sp. XZX-3]|uniref:lipocalin family protein n=1 Tax=unclassified Halobacteriovorax TaxID=2639665 RepID=UPI001304B136|nr:lipocalin family protein [Halobacteriovorax sp. DA5]
MKKVLIFLATLPFFFNTALAERKSGEEVKLSTTETVGAMKHTKRFRNFLSAAKIAGLDDIVTIDHPITIFAPNDAAFAKLPPETVEYLLANPLELRKLLLYHIGYGRHEKSDLRQKKEVKTFHGRVILVDQDSEEFILNSSTLRLGTLKKHDRNIIVHEINEVLLPSEELPANNFQTVEYVDLSRYLGTWYQQGAYDAFFNLRCQGTKAEYKLKHNRIRVKNSCQLVNGEEKVDKAYAKVVDKISNAKLKVSFVPLLGYFGVGAGDYQIIHLDEEYTEAIVADRNRNTLFILTRDREIAESKYEELVQIAVNQGFRPEYIKRTPVYEVVEPAEPTEPTVEPTEPNDHTDGDNHDGDHDGDIVITDPVETEVIF